MNFSALTPVIMSLWVLVALSVLGKIAMALAIERRLPARNFWLIIWQWISGGCGMTISTIAAQAYLQKALSAHWALITILMSFVVVFGLQWWINRRYPKIEPPGN